MTSKKDSLIRFGIFAFCVALALMCTALAAMGYITLFGWAFGLP